MNDLKKIVHDIINNKQVDIQQDDMNFQPVFINKNDNLYSTPTSGIEIKSEKANRENIQFTANMDDIEDFQEADEYNVLESDSKPTSLSDMERQMIKDSLEKYSGKRKLAAKELKISERTLYRKIKEYGIE